MTRKKVRQTALRKGFSFLFTGSVRRVAATIALAAILPAVGIILFVALTDREQSLREAESGAIHLVQDAEEDQEGTAQSVRQFLTALSKNPHLQNEGGCTPAFLADVAATNPLISTLFVVNATGETVTASAPAASESLGDHDYFKRAIATDSFTVGECQIDKASHPVLPFACPLHDAKGAVTGAVCATIDLQRVYQIFVQASLPQDSVLSVTDRNGVCLCRFPAETSAPQPLGLPPALFRAIERSGGQGTALLTGPKGVKRIYAFTQLKLAPDDPPYGTAIVEVPEKTWFAQANSRFTREMLFLPLALAWALITAWILGSRMLNNILEARARRRENADRIIRHNLKSPLASLAYMPALLLNDANLTAGQCEHLTTMQDTILRMLHNIDLSTAVSKMEDQTYHSDMSPFNLAAVVRLVVHESAPFARSRQVGIAALLDQAPLGENASFLLPGERDFCIIMLENLMKNAIEASPPGETVRVSLDSGARTLVLSNKGEVPPAIRSRFFEKYATAGKKWGSGLGAYSAWLIATTMGWDIRLDTSVAGQTAISIRFPRVK